MLKYRLTFLFAIALFCLVYLPGFGQTDDIRGSLNKQIDLDLKGPSREDQTLFNGRVWRNLYYKVREDQFLYSKTYLPGSVSIDGITFRNVDLLYDIYTDEIITHTSNGSFLQLNKEMADSFSIVFDNTKRYFFRTDIDTIKGYNGYMNILYTGKSSLHVKYKKEIELLAVDRKFDEFYQTHRIFLVKDSVINQITGKRDFLMLLEDEKTALKSFIKKNKLFVSVKKPESLIPVIRYYDSLKK
ncbi:MAG: hypothetical protein IPH69_16765 [Bacteroidales bacterium]|nr:hypothetical protein [Bacteroidales bacterium]